MTDNDFRLRLGRIRDRGARARTFVSQVLEAAVRAGYAKRTGVQNAGRFGRGRGAALAARLRSPARRVVVKARVVRHAGRRYRGAPLAVHVSYLKREGVDRDGGVGRMFDARGDADERAFAERCDGDRHHFRFIVSPEDAAELASLKSYARELMRKAEADLGTGLDWIAVDHWNTAHPHVHILVRGVDQDGADLVISPDYITHGLRARAEALASLELGPRSAREVAASLQREMSAERWTRLDELTQARAVDGRIDLRPGAGDGDLELRALLVGRAAALQRLGLAKPEGPGVWRLDPERRTRLRELARRGDIIATLHKAIGERRSLEELELYGERRNSPLVGRVAARGLHDELSGEAFLILDGVDGRAHHIRLPDLDASSDTPIGGLVEVRPAARGAQVVHRSDIAIEAQMHASGATWLDRQLLAREPEPLAESGFGAEVRRALAAREQHLIETGLARPGGARPTLRKDLLAHLRERELAAAGARLAQETRLRFDSATEDPVIAGVYRRRVDLASGRFAMIEDGLGFRLAPWSRVLDRQLGREVRGMLTPERVEWDLGRSRGLSR